MSQAITKEALKTHSFTLVFEGEFDELSDDLLGGLLGAGCDDSHVGISELVLRITFDREAPSFRVALTSAIADVERAGLGLVLARVEPA